MHFASLEKYIRHTCIIITPCRTPLSSHSLNTRAKNRDQSLPALCLISLFLAARTSGARSDRIAESLVSILIPTPGLSAPVLD